MLPRIDSESAIDTKSPQQRAQFLQRLVDGSLDIITVLDQEGRICFENNAAEQVLGFPRGELIGKWAFDLVHPDDLDGALAAFANVVSQPNGTASAEFRYRTKDGSWRYMAAVGRNLIHEPAIAGVVTTLRDITAQKQAELNLRESEQRFRQLTENVRDVFWISNPDATQVHFVSRAYEAVWGRSCESLLAAPHSFLESVHPEDRGEVERCLRENAQGLPSTAEYRIIRPDGSVRWILDRGFPVLDKQGAVYRCAGLAKDITQQRCRDDLVNKLMLAVQHSPAAVVITSIDGTIEFVNPKFTEMTGYTFEEAVGQNPRILKSGKHDATFYREMWDTIKAGGVWSGEMCNRRKDGTLYWESVSVSGVRNERDAITNYVAVKEDITEKVRAREQLHLQSSALAAAANSIFITDQQGRILWANAAFCRMSGYELGELVDKTPRLLKSGRHDAEFYTALWNTISAGQAWSGEVIERRKSGEYFTVQQTITPLTNGDGSVTHFIAVQEDITARKDAEARIEELAFHDALTNLPNRVQLQQQLAKAVQQAQQRGHSLALHFIDLDRFKVVNDTLGHAAGDSLLQAVADRLKGCLSASDTPARLGGDEFAVLQRDIKRVADATALARQIIRAMASPFRVADRDIHVTPSIGISVFPTDSSGPEELLRNADLAMYVAKREGRNNFHYFTASLNEQLRDRLALEVDLRSAFERQEFALHYQPQVDLRTGSLCGMEALIRWRHPSRGLVPPDLFVGVAEECGLIHPLTRWVLEEACAQNAAWQAAGLPAVRVAVNVSATNFKQGDMCQIVADVLARTRLPAELLQLEVTETLLLQSDYVAQAIPELRRLGVTLSIDDFGTGYSSLDYLRRLPVGELKIDRSFIRGLPDNQDDAIIAKAIIELGHALHLTVIAEGIETEEQLEYLRAEGCDQGQGYLFGAPMPASDVAARVFAKRPTSERQATTPRWWAAAIPHAAS